MRVHSAGILCHHGVGDDVRVFLGHMGGPYWARKDDGGWSIPKGEFDPATEDARDAALREFREETGVALAGPLAVLGEFQVTRDKLLHVFTCRVAARFEFQGSNQFELEWPPRSGRRQWFPELDRAAWSTPAEAERRLVKGQRPVVAALLAQLDGSVA